MTNLLTTDSTGLAGAYREEDVDRGGVKLPSVVVDFALRINPPPPPKKISITRVRSFLIYLHKEQGIEFGKITYDSYASAESIPSSYREWV